MKQTSFATLGLRPQLLENLGSLQFTSMTAIQAKSLPAILGGADVIAQGNTGSGKTAAFGLGLLHKLEVASFKVQALVLCPTRELSEQVANEIRRLARAIPNVKVITVYGGTSIKAQADSLSKGAHIVVGTPGRIEDLLSKQSLDLSQLTTLVLDEADRMLDMGFQATLESIVEALPAKRQTLLFSATYPPQIESIGRSITQDAQLIQVADTQDRVRIDENFYAVENDADRLQTLKLLLLDAQDTQVVVFCNTRDETQKLAGSLKSAGFSAAPLHGDMEQKDRDQTLIRFSNQSLLTLVATDVAARGLDIESLDRVINYHLPRELQVYTHRIGRTGRAGAKGAADSLVQASEQFRLEQLQASLGRELAFIDPPAVELLAQQASRPLNSTLRVEGGKKQKLRPGDLVGALTKGGEIGAQQIGKIQVMDNWAYIALRREVARQGLKKLSQDKIKGKSFRARLI